MRVELRDALHIDPERGSRRKLSLSVLLALLVVVAAGLAGTIRFGKPRWVPHFTITRRLAPPHKLKSGAPAHRKLRAPHATISFPFAQLLEWTILAIIVLAIAWVLWRWWANRPSRAATGRSGASVSAVRQVAMEPEPEPDAPVLRSGLELALALLDEERQPADAIVRAWLGLQEAAEESGIVREPAETPTEFTSRIMKRVVSDDRPVRTLLRLYLRTRFGDHPVTADDVASVRSALQELIAAWPTPSPPAGIRRGL